MSDANAAATSANSASATTTTQPTPAAEAAGASSGGTAAAAPTDWTTSLSEEVRGYAQTKGWKDPSSAISSYQNLEKLHGVPAERLLKLPEKSDDPAWGSVYERLGKPKTPDEYGLKADESPEGKEFAAWAAKTFHGLNLTRAQAEKLTANYAEYAKGFQEAKEKAGSQDVERQDAELKKEWGMAFDQKLKTAKAAVREFGIQADVVDKLQSALGYAGVLKLMSAIGEKIGEDKFIADTDKKNGFNGMLTPDAAKYQIKALKEDKDFMRRWMDGGVAEKEKLTQLTRMAYPDAI